MLKKMLCYFLFLTAISATSSRSLANTPDDIVANTAATPSSEDKTASPALTSAPEDKEKKQTKQSKSKQTTPQQVFKPSEEISEDFSVPFPSDI